MSVEQGLSQRSVLSILQDKTGFLWVGTFDGLNRYDGRRFRVYKHETDNPNSPSDSAVWSIFEDRKGVLWIGTQNGGLNKFDPETETFTRYLNVPDDPNSLSNNTVWTIIEDRSGKLWIGTRGGGINRFDPDTGKFIRFMNNPDDPGSLSSNMVMRVYEDRSGMIWVATMAGLNKLDPETGTFTRYTNNPDDPESLSHNSINSIYEDSKGLLWIGTRQGLNRLDPGTTKFIRYFNEPDDPDSLSSNKVSSIYEDHEGMIWVGTLGGGINRFDRETSQFRRLINDPDDPHSLSHNEVTSIYEDRSKIIWVGTRRGGLNKFDPGRKKFHLYQRNPNDPDSLCNNIVRPMIEDRLGKIWIGTEGGLDRFDPSTGLFTHFRKDPNDPNSPGSNNIWALCEDRSGVLWIGTFDKGLDRFDPQTKKFTHYRADPTDPNSLSLDIVMSLHQDSTGMIWVGTYGGGLNRLDPKTCRFRHFRNDPNDPGSLSSNSIMSISEDTSGALWVGTMGGGLNRLDQKTGRFKRFQNDPDDPGSLSFNAVYSICEDSSGTLWIGTNGGGLNRFNREDETFTHYRKKHGLPDENILAITEDDDGNLWLNTQKGLSKFDPKSLTFRNYDKRDDLQGDIFTRGSLKTRRGEILVAGTNGFNTFYPREITDNPHVPEVVLTDFRLFNETVPVGEGAEGRSILKKSITATREIALSHRDDIIFFEFAALQFTSPEKNEFAYIMEGFEDKWNHVGNRNFATYTNLPPGRFVFRVKASNNDGIWNEEGTSLNITVTPPFWQTLWFRSLSAAALIALFFTVYRIRIESIRKRNLELEEFNLQLNEHIRERKMAEEALRESEDKLRAIFENVNDEIVYLDDQGTVLDVNKRVEDIFGYKPEELIGKNIGEIQFCHPDSMEEQMEQFDSALSGSIRNLVELVGVRKDGSEVLVETSTSAIKKNGEIKNILSVIRDITKRKKLEAQLQHSQKMEALGTLAGGIAHEFNNILGIMVGNIELAMDGVPEGNPVHGNLEKARTACLRARDVVSQILAFSRQSQQKLNPTKLATIVKDSLKLLRSSIPTSIEIRRNISIDTDIVNADPTQINQILLNLCANAAYAMRDKGGVLEISLENVELDESSIKRYRDLNPGIYAKLSVRDTGYGIAPELIDRVFDPYFTTKEFGEGTGLGLSVVHGIVKNHGGDITVHSQPGKGTTFHILFPVIDIEFKPKIKFEEPVPGGNERILFVDDEEALVLASKNFLEDLGYEVVAETDPVKTLETFKQAPEAFDLVITDMTMPNMTGDRLAREIMKIRSDIPVILCTGYSEHISEEQAKAMGIGAFVMKPALIWEMAKTIRQVLDEEKA